MILSDDQLTALATAAAVAARNAYAPYSGFHVAALLLGDDGDLLASGVNMENASYGLAICAETSALAAATRAGRLAEVRAVVVIGGRLANGDLIGDAPVLPCGRCRQLIHESAALRGRDIDLYCFSGDRARLTRTSIHTLLPDAFGPASLG